MVIITLTSQQVFFLAVGFGLLGVCCLILVYYLVVLKRDQKQRSVKHHEAVDQLDLQINKTKEQLKQLMLTNNQRSNYMNSVFATMEDGVVVVNKELEIRFVNPAAREYLSVDNQALFKLSQCDFSFLLQKTLMLCQKTLGERVSASLCVEDKGCFFDISTTLIWNRYAKDDLLGVLAIVKDVTDNHRVEKMRKEFVSNVSHEFRTPITLIAGFIEMLKINDDLSIEEQRRALEIIDVETERLKRLISELLSLSQIEGSLSKDNDSYIDIEDIADQIHTTLLPLATQKDISFSHEIDIDYPVLRGNEQFLYQAISNLVENAIKYTPVQGNVVLRIYMKNQMIYIEVEDNGIGIPESELERIFERFYRVDQTRSSQSGGSGIGLSIVKNIAVMFQGEVFVQSKEGVGSLFRMEIPASKES